MMRRYVLAALGVLTITATPGLMAGQGPPARDPSRGYSVRPGMGGTRLSGTYELDQRASEDPRLVVNRATQSMPPGRRDRIAQNWISRLDAPQTLTLDVTGRRVSIMSSSAPQLTFDADGRDRTEQGAYGSPVTTRADLRGDRLTVSTTGNRGSDFTVTFEAAPGGLRVTRRLDSDYQQASVTVQSFYRRVAEPRWNVYHERRAIVPAGTRLTAQLNRPLSSRTTRDGERFSMTVVGTDQRDPLYRAVIDGVVTHTSGPNGRPSMVFDFDHIQLADGRSAAFEAEIEAVQTPDNAPIRVDRSGVVHDRGGSQTVQNGAVGATIGAIIGAMAGGKKGAVVGAVAGGSAGILLIDGRSDLSLPTGTMITISAISSQ